MIGGLKKTVSRLAIVAAAGAMSSTAAMAADLGGDCCADLEERVAELEATTVRKGNRKVSLTLSGHVNEHIMFWDDGFESNVYINTNVHSRTRFRMRGSATINSDWSAGFYIEVGMTRTGSSLNTDQWSDDTRIGDGMDVRHQALYMKSKTFGTFWLGHTSDAYDGIEALCVGCVLNNVPESQLAWGGMHAQANGGQYSTVAVGALGAGRISNITSRRDLIRWISPAWGGFVLSADYGEDDEWAASLRFAREHYGFRVAAGIGYSQRTDTGINVGDSRDETIGGSVSVGHVSSGLYWAFSMGELTDDSVDRIAGRDGKLNHWWTTVGIGRKWHALGKTTIYAQYGRNEGGYVAGGLCNAQNVRSPSVGTCAGGVIGAGGAFTSSEWDVWSIGLNQKIDAAAMELYLAYYNVDGDSTHSIAGNLDWDTQHYIQMGARIRF